MISFKGRQEFIQYMPKKPTKWGLKAFMLFNPHNAGAFTIGIYIYKCTYAHAAERPDWTSLEEIDTPLCQRPLPYCIDEAVYNQLLSVAPDSQSRALVLSTSLPHTGDWLNVVPSSMLSLHLQDKEFRLCLKYCLGLRISNERIICPVCQVHDY